MTFPPWLVKHREAVARPLIEGFIRTVRLIPGTDKVGVIGFCWGGRYALLAGHAEFSSGEGQGVDAVYALHPSLVAIPGDFDPIAVPTSIAVGDKDSLLGMKEVEQIKEIMDKRKDTEVRIYKDQIHGWSLRGDFSSEKDKKAMAPVHVLPRNLLRNDLIMEEKGKAINLEADEEEEDFEEILIEEEDEEMEEET